MRTDVRIRSLTVSPSQKALWDLCQRKWWLRYGEQLEAPPSGILHAGSAAHFALESYFQDIKGGSKANLDLLISAFLERFGSGSDFNWKGLSKEKMVSGLVAALSKFHRHLGRKITPENIEHRFSVPLFGKIKLVGVLDLAGLYQCSVDEPPSPVICEWKTTRYLPSKPKVNHDFQVRTYQAFNPQQALIVYLGWEEKGMRVFVVDPPPEKLKSKIVKDYRDFVRSRQDAIVSASFAPAPRGHKLCSKRWCDFWKECHRYPWDKLRPEAVVERLLDSRLLEELD